MISMCSRRSSMLIPHLAREFGNLVVLQQAQVLGDDLVGRRALEAEGAQLQREALLQVAGGHARRVEALHQTQHLLDGIDRPRAHLGDFAHRGDQFPVVVQIADDGRADGAFDLVVRLERKLPLEVVGQRRPGRQGVLDGRQFLDLGGHARAVALVEVFAEEILVVVVFPVVGLALGPLGVLLVGLVGGRLCLGGLQVLARNLLQQGVLDHLLVQHVGKLERRHRQQLDRLLERRRQNELLREPRLELLVNGHERCRSPTRVTRDPRSDSSSPLQES